MKTRTQKLADKNKELNLDHVNDGEQVNEKIQWAWDNWDIDFSEFYDDDCKPEQYTDSFREDFIENMDKLTIQTLLQEIAEGFVNLRNAEDYIETVYLSSDKTFEFRVLDNEFCAVKLNKWEVIRSAELKKWADKLQY